MAAAAALDSAAFSRVNASEAVPATWEERARKAWEYNVEEPLVKNCVNSWRTFAVGEEIKITGDDDKLRKDGEDMVNIGAVMEYGAMIKLPNGATIIIPPQPFLHPVMEKYREQIVGNYRRAIYAVLR